MVLKTRYPRASTTTAPASKNFFCLRSFWRRPRGTASAARDLSIVRLSIMLPSYYLLATVRAESVVALQARPAATAEAARPGRRIGWLLFGSRGDRHRGRACWWRRFR